MRQQFTFYDYLLLEEVSTVKHEFLNGVVWAMAGGSPDHARIAANVTALLAAQLRGRPCGIYSSDLRVRVRETGLATYPDVTVICGQLEIDAEDPKGHTAINPKLVVEVLSPSTAAYDKGEKLSHYQRIETLEEVVLVAHDERRVDVWRREPDGWKLHTVHDGTAELSLLGCSLPLDEVYRDPLAF